VDQKEVFFISFASLHPVHFRGIKEPIGADQIHGQTEPLHFQRVTGTVTMTAQLLVENKYFSLYFTHAILLTSVQFGRDKLVAGTIRQTM
jgi:hypothetical protein